MPETSASRFADLHLPTHEAEQARAAFGRADADIRPTRERYYPLDRPLPLSLEASTETLEAATALPTNALARKHVPLVSGLLDYFPAALAAVAVLSEVGNEQHNPGQPLAWDRSKSGDEADALLRHLTERGTIDTDGMRHSVKVAWRALALLQKELEAEGLAPVSSGSR